MNYLKDFFQSIKFKIVLAILFVFVGMGIYTVANPQQVPLLSQGLYTIFEPILKVTSSVSDSISSNIDAISNAKEYYDENLELKQQISDLNEQLVDYENNKSELEELKKFINIKEDNPEDELSAPCNIISKSSTAPYYTFTIDRGAKDGISLYDPVVTGDGLVGIISEISERYSVVTTILSPDISVGAISKQSKDMGIVQGNSTQGIDGLTKLIYLDNENKVKKGNTIVCSGNSGTFPKDFLIGTVTEVGIEETGLSSYAIVKPFVDIEKLTSVIVITDFEGQGIGSSQ